MKASPAWGLLTLMAVTACHRDNTDASADAPMQLGIENIAVVSSGVIESGPLVSGTLAPSRVAQIRAQVGGSVLGVFAEQGGHVARGDILAHIDATAIRESCYSARTSAASAQTAFHIALDQSKRYEQLFKAGAVSQHDEETVGEQMISARANLSNAQAQQAAACQQLDYTDVRAPFAGIVSDRTVNAGDIVQIGTPLYTVVDPSRLQLQAAVPAEQIASVRVGAPVLFTLNGYTERTFVGHVTRINPVADPSTRQVQVYAEIPNPGNTLVGGLFATGRIVTERDSGLVLPSAAIDTRNLHPAVERVHNGTVQQVDVTIGNRDTRTDHVQVTSGLALGDTVLLGTAQGLSVGTRVTVVRSASDSALNSTQ